MQLGYKDMPNGCGPNAVHPYNHKSLKLNKKHFELKHSWLTTIDKNK